MRHLLALLLLVAATLHPVAHHHSIVLVHEPMLVDATTTQDCPCTHAAAVATPSPGVARALDAPAPRRAQTVDGFAPAPLALELPSRAPPAAA